MTETSTYKCDFCDSEESFGCFTCLKRYCSQHGNVELSRCEECSNLEAIGDTYRFRLLDGRVVEDVSLIEDHELKRLLQMYSRKVKELETLISSARKQSNVLRKQLRLVPVGEDSGRVGAVKPQSTISAVDKTLAKMLKDGDAAEMLKRLKANTEEKRK